jgi:hypothetical protein
VTDVDDSDEDTDSQGPAAKIPRTDLIGDYVLTQVERNKALTDLRVKLDENLIGPYSEERHKIMDRFIKSHIGLKPSEVDYNLCLAFLNCLLDKSFTSFCLTGEEVNHPFEDFDPLELIPVISQQSPDLKFLSLYFAISSTEHTLVPALCTSFKSFKLLTSLKLEYKWKRNTKKVDFIPFIASLGELCPKLIHLSLTGPNIFTIKHLLALVLGKKHELLPQQLIDQLFTDVSLVAHLQFTRDCVSPICSTLQQLNVDHFSSHGMAFVLRHFPKLQKYVRSLPIVKAVHLLYEQQQNPTSPIIFIQRSSEELGVVEWTPNAPFPGIS